MIPVIRLLGSNTSILSSKSIAKGEAFGNLAENCCLGNCGSCLTYLRALSLCRKLILESSGEPMSFKETKDPEHIINFVSKFLKYKENKGRSKKYEGPLIKSDNILI